MWGSDDNDMLNWNSNLLKWQPSTTLTDLRVIPLLPFDYFLELNILNVMIDLYTLSVKESEKMENLNTLSNMRRTEDRRLFVLAQPENKAFGVIKMDNDLHSLNIDATLKATQNTHGSRTQKEAQAGEASKLEALSCVSWKEFQAQDMCLKDANNVTSYN